MHSQFKTTKQFIDVILNHNFSSKYLNIVVKKLTYSTCAFTITDKKTKTEYKSRFGAFKENDELLGMLRIANKNFIVAEVGDKVTLTKEIDVKADMFLSFIDSSLIGVAD